MKKNNTSLKSPKGNKTRKRSITIGMDLGEDKKQPLLCDRQRGSDGAGRDGGNH